MVHLTITQWVPLVWSREQLKLDTYQHILSSLNYPNFEAESRKGKQSVKDENNGIFFNSFRLWMATMEQPTCRSVPTHNSTIYVTLENCKTLVGKTIQVVDARDKTIEGEDKSNKTEERHKETSGDEPVEQQNKPHSDKDTKDEHELSQESNLGSRETSATDQGQGTNASIKKPTSSELDNGIEPIDQREEPVSRNVEEINKATEIDVTSERMASFPPDEKSKDGEDQNIPIMDQPLESGKLIDRGNTINSEFDNEKDENVKTCPLELVDSEESLPPMPDPKQKLSKLDDLEQKKVDNLSSTPSKVSLDDDKINEPAQQEPVSSQKVGNNQDAKVGQEPQSNDNSMSESIIIDLDERPIIKSESALQVQKSESKTNHEKDSNQDSNQVGLESNTNFEPLSTDDKIQVGPEPKGKQDQTTPDKKKSVAKKKVVKKKQRDEKRINDRAEEGIETDIVVKDEVDLVGTDNLEDSNLDSSSHFDQSESQKSSEQILEENDPLLQSMEAQEVLPEPTTSADVTDMDSRSHDPDHHLNESDHLTPTGENENLQSVHEIKTGTLKDHGGEQRPRQRTLVSSFESSQESIQNLLTTFRPQRRHEQLLSTSFITYQEVTSSNRNRNMSKLLVPAHPKSYLPVYF
ncbi:myb-like protein X [Tigriopus californicus]|uniref:myb-like protein X n=1 Tax=Tigriopus californicus TaxID=6832 RepID=UPI0027D9D045|nr:myb-like protein X [Tigriopus californicus]